MLFRIFVQLDFVVSKIEKKVLLDFDLGFAFVVDGWFDGGVEGALMVQKLLVPNDVVLYIERVGVRHVGFHLLGRFSIYYNKLNNKYNYIRLI